MPHETTLDKLAAHDIVLKIAGEWRPFPQIVARVITTGATTEVRFIRGEPIPRLASDTPVLVDGAKA